MSTACRTLVAVVDYFVPDPERPYLLTRVCERCGARYLERRNGCGRCGGTNFSRQPVVGFGTVKAYTVVWRDSPGIETPFISCLVDLGDGLVVKSNLVGVDAASIDGSVLGQPVKLIAYNLPPDSTGTVACAFAFELGNEEAR
jgi:uncharacterized OB-fold protein